MQIFAFTYLSLLPAEFFLLRILWHRDVVLVGMMTGLFFCLMHAFFILRYHNENPVPLPPEMD